MMVWTARHKSKQESLTPYTQYTGYFNVAVSNYFANDHFQIMGQFNQTIRRQLSTRKLQVLLLVALTVKSRQAYGPARFYRLLAPYRMLIKATHEF